MKMFFAFAMWCIVLAHAKIPGGYTEIYRSSVGNKGKVIYLGTYGYDLGGVCEVFVSHNISKTSGSLRQAGFFLSPAESANQARENQKSNEENLCSQLDHLRDSLNMQLTGSPGSGEYRSQIVIKSVPGYYALYFYNCRDNDVELSGHAMQYNRDPPPNGDVNFLQVGDWPKPTMYLFFFACEMIMLVAWCVYLKKSLPANRYKIHYYFVILLVLYSLCLLMQTVKYDQFRRTGNTSEVIHGFYGMFVILRGCILVIGVILLGTGWSVLKPHLGDREKKIFAVVIPLQLIVNISEVILEELSEGSESWLSWKDTLRILDIVCCCVILLPIVWSIKTLKDSAGTDGKVATNIARLKQFRALYIVLVAYVYYTRIVMVIVEESLHFRYCWLATFFNELGTLLFFLFVGIRFRPCDKNPYLKLDAEDLDTQEAQRELEERQQIADDAAFDNEPHEGTGVATNATVGTGGTASAMLGHATIRKPNQDA